MSKAFERPENIESEKQGSIERKGVSQNLKELRQAIAALEAEWEVSVEAQTDAIVAQVLRISSLEKEIESLRGEYQQKVQGLEEQVDQREREVQDLRNEAEQLRQKIATIEPERGKFNQRITELKEPFEELKSRLQMLSQGMIARDQRLKQYKQTYQTTEAEHLRQTITSLETDKEVLGQEISELKRQLQESRHRLELSAQQVAARDKKLGEVNRTHEVLVEKLNAEIQEKMARIGGLEGGIQNPESEYLQKAQTFKEDEILKGLPKGGRDHVMKKLLEDLTGARRFFLKATCPHCKGKISSRYKVDGVELVGKG